MYNDTRSAFSFWRKQRPDLRVVCIQSRKFFFLIHTNTHAHAHKHKHTQMHTHSLSHKTNTNAYTCTQTQTQTHIHTHVHTHAQKGGLESGKTSQTSFWTPAHFYKSTPTYHTRQAALMMSQLQWRKEEKLQTATPHTRQQYSCLKANYSLMKTSTPLNDRSLNFDCQSIINLIFDLAWHVLVLLELLRWARVKRCG